MIYRLAIFLRKHYWIFLAIVVLIAYGQIVNMYVYKDDNAIFFKFFHLAEPAGYFGRGLFGEGIYRFSVTPYWFVYKLFGVGSTTPYYALILLFYFFSTLAVWKLFSKIISLQAGRIAGFVFATGYIAQEGFSFLSTAMLINVGVILAAPSIYFYLKFIENDKFRPYLFSLLLYFAAILITPVRMHYFIGVIVAAELVFFTVGNIRKNISESLWRLTPFLLLFYSYFLKGGDSRSETITEFVTSLLSGKFYVTYNTISSFANLFISDQITSKLSSVPGIWILWSILVVYIVWRIVKGSHRKKLNILFIGMAFIWPLVARNIFTNILLSIGPAKLFIVLVGGSLMIIFSSVLFRLREKQRAMLGFLLAWVLTNTMAYTAYQPLSYYSSTGRFLAHSFIPLAGIFGFLFVQSSKIKLKQASLLKIAILGLALFNLYSSFSSQKAIVVNRSIPAKAFHDQLKILLPEISKDDILYFDVADDARGYFASAFSVSSMPETTALAWRYGVDRYDFQMVTNSDQLFSLLAESEEIDLGKIYTFFYSGERLIDTSVNFREALVEKTAAKQIEFQSELIDGEMVISLKDSLDSVSPLELSLDLIASSFDPQLLSFPLVSNQMMVKNSVALNESKRRDAFSYLDFKRKFIADTKVFTSSDWKQEVSQNLTDGNDLTIWRGDRILWGKGKSTITLDLGEESEIDRLVWRNGYANNTPTQYLVEVSSDLEKWEEAYEISNSVKIEPVNLQVIDFNKSYNVRYVRMSLIKSLNSDSPGVAEIWVVPTRFHDLNILDAESYILNPFGYVENASTFMETISRMNGAGLVSISWKTNKSHKWQTSHDARTVFSFDKVRHTYSVIVSPSGTQIDKIKLSDLQIPGEIEINEVSYRNLDLSEVLERQ